MFALSRPRIFTGSSHSPCRVRFPFSWTAPKPAPVLDLRETRLGDLLRAAAQVRYYRRSGVEPLEPGLAPAVQLRRMPRVELEYFLRHPEDFYNWGSPAKNLRALDCPLRNLGRIAVLQTGFRETEAIQVFAGPRMADLQNFNPETLAGPAAKLRMLAEVVLKGRFVLPAIQYAVLPFTGLKHGCLRDEDRDLLWRAFKVPVFEQFRGFSNELLAWECEAHQGLHIVADNVIFEPAPGGDLLATCLNSGEYTLIKLATEMSGRVDSTVCGCNLATPRLVEVGLSCCA